MSLFGCKSNIYKSRFKTGYKFVQRNRWAGGSSLSPLIFIWRRRDKWKRGEARAGGNEECSGGTGEGGGAGPGLAMEWRSQGRGKPKGADSKARTHSRSEECLHLHRQPPPPAVAESTAWQLGGSPNTLGITLQQQHLFTESRRREVTPAFTHFMQCCTTCRFVGSFSTEDYPA